MLHKHHDPPVCSILRVCHLLHVLLVLAGQATCRPMRNLTGSPLRMDIRNTHKDRLGIRQTEIVHIAKNVTFFHSVAIECCTLTFTPVTLPDGNPAVRVVKSCTLENTAEDPGGTCGGSGASTTQSTVAASGTSLSTAVVSTDTSTMTNPPSTSVSLSSLSGMTTLVSSSASTFTIPTLSSSPSFSSTSTLTSESAISTSSPSDTTNVTFTSTSAVRTDTPTPNTDASTSTKQSSTLPKLIGGFAGVSVLLLIIGGTVGYLKQKKMAKDEDHEIRWPVTS